MVWCYDCERMAVTVPCRWQGALWTPVPRYMLGGWTPSTKMPTRCLEDWAGLIDRVRVCVCVCVCVCTRAHLPTCMHAVKCGHPAFFSNRCSFCLQEVVRELIRMTVMAMNSHSNSSMQRRKPERFLYFIPYTSWAEWLSTPFPLLCLSPFFLINLLSLCLSLPPHLFVTFISGLLSCAEVESCTDNWKECEIFGCQYFWPGIWGRTCVIIRLV